MPRHDDESERKTRDKGNVKNEDAGGELGAILSECEDQVCFPTPAQYGSETSDTIELVRKFYQVSFAVKLVVNFKSIVFSFSHCLGKDLSSWFPRFPIQSYIRPLI